MLSNIAVKSDENYRQLSLIVGDIDHLSGLFVLATMMKLKSQ
jgi:hypothetical protein